LPVHFAKRYSYARNGLERIGIMKQVIMKSVYAGLGLLNTGKQTVEQLGRKIAEAADLSEKDGEKVARRLRVQSDKAINSLHKILQTEVKKTVGALHTAARAHVVNLSSKKRKAKAGPKHGRAAHKTVSK
jgi:hypothetical protein